MRPSPSPATPGALLAATLALALLGGCSRKTTDDGTAPATMRDLPALTIKDETADLMLTWIDGKGDTHVELRPQDVPAEGRALVRVVVSDREDGTHDRFYVADLGQKREDGSYPTRTLRRRDWESEIEKRRDAYLARTAPPRPASSDAQGRPSPAQANGAVTVIIYGASWCGPCHQAADWLKQKGVPYVLKDVETTPGAAAELQEKLSRSGQRGGSIPVLDVRGQILVGWNPIVVERAVERARGGAGTTL